MSAFIKNTKGLLGIAVFVVGLWAVVVVTYASQVKQQEAKMGMRPLTEEGCSSSSSNSSGGEP